MTRAISCSVAPMLWAASRYCSSMVRMPAAVDSITGRSHRRRRRQFDSDPMPNRAVKIG